MNIKLVKLEKKYETQCVEMLKEWKEYNDAHPEANHSPWAIFKSDYHNFDQYLKDVNSNIVPEGKVPDTTLFALDVDRNIFVGATNIRHYLNEALMNGGGHIGDGVRPSERRKGFATEIIRLSLIECKKLNIDKVMICCSKSNIGSKKSIENNGGVFDHEIIGDEGDTELIYWICNK